MKIKFMQVGKTVEDYLRTGVSLYENRLVHYAPFSVETVPDLKNAKSLSEEEIKRQEGKMILERLSQSDMLILLDENGKQFSSVDFASYIDKLGQTAGNRQIVFLIGGPYGFSDEVYGRAEGKVSLSKMTYSHQMVRLIFLEQLYRAFTIIRGEPYHHR